MTVAGE
jgi:hypothetical protein